MNGGSIISDDMTKATVNEPAAVEAVKFYTDMLVTNHVSPPSTCRTTARRTGASSSPRPWRSTSRASST